MTDNSSEADALAGAVDQALALLEEHFGNQAYELKASDPLPSLLEQCEAFCAAAEAQRPEPVRTLHHLACTGGTLIAKCIAAMPNAVLLSEVDPLSPLAHRRRFVPSDLVGLAKFSSRPPVPEVLMKIFLAGLNALYDEVRRTGGNLVLRDHAHSHFTYGPGIERRASLREILEGAYRLRSVLTVRHPFDSYLGLQFNGWLHFSPPTIEEYARRYHAFLDHYDDLECIRYEDFVNDPKKEMQRICTLLELCYDPGFMEIFAAIRLSGDSGRRGSEIAARPRRSYSHDLARQASESRTFNVLLDRLGYETNGILV